MQPLRATAYLQGPVAMDMIHIDALLAYAVCVQEGIELATTEDQLVPIEVPVEREPGGRFHLASASVVEWELLERKYLIRRFPVEQAVHHSRMKRVNLAAGKQKHFRIPYQVGYAAWDRVTWFLLADLAEVRRRLSAIHHLGRKRSCGLGRIRRWEFEVVEPWPGFPVVSPDGRAMRHLPPDWPGVTESHVRYGNLTYPYWRRSTEELVLCPG